MLKSQRGKVHLKIGKLETRSKNLYEKVFYYPRFWNLSKNDRWFSFSNRDEFGFWNTGNVWSSELKSNFKSNVFQMVNTNVNGSDIVIKELQLTNMVWSVRSRTYRAQWGDTWKKKHIVCSFLSAEGIHWWLNVPSCPGCAVCGLPMSPILLDKDISAEPVQPGENSQFC